MELTKPQVDIIKAVDNHWKLYNAGATEREMLNALNCTKSFYDWHRRKLVDAGYLTRVPGRHRDLRLTESAKEVLT